MRSAFAALVLFGMSALLAAQPPKEPPKEPPKDPKGAPKEAPKDDEVVPPKPPGPRYGVKPRLKAYPQSTPKEALRSALSAIDTSDYSYLTAHLLDPKFVDGVIAERAGPLEPTVRAELVQARDAQRPNINNIAVEDRIPYEPNAFAALVTERARERVFRQLIKELEQKLAEDAHALKDMRRILRKFPEGDAATVTLPEIKGRVLYFQKIGDRWFLDNRSAPEEPKKEP